MENNEHEVYAAERENFTFKILNLIFFNFNYLSPSK